MTNQVLTALSRAGTGRRLPPSSPAARSCTRSATITQPEDGRDHELSDRVREDPAGLGPGEHALLQELLDRLAAC
ncbi:hypothetical protein [Actinophytocola oryzae]|uniref:hypothetical protein n=1 Tax=Actinophytocola oryzae TaxID=502181 RepID=UPI001063929D